MRKHGLGMGMVLTMLLSITACSAQTDAATSRNQATATPAALAPLSTPVAPLDPEAMINDMIAKMTLDQKIGQMFMVEFLGNQYNGYLDGMIRGAHVGGLLIYNNDQRTIPEMQQLNADAQANADFPLFLALDEEGGEVNRLAEFYGYFPPAQTMAESGDPSYAEGEGAKAARLMLGLGFNVNLAPVVDVATIPNPVEGTRIFADTPTKTDLYAGAFLAGTQSQGVAGALKHWPGIGASTGDPHSSLPMVPHSLNELNSIDYAAFKGLLSQGPAMIMVTHVMVPAVDPTYPATLSSTLVNGTLRGKLGYQGVVITDSLHMEGIYDFERSRGITDYPRMLDEATIQAILAGDDILEGGFDPFSAQSMLQAVHDAVQSGRIPLSRIEESDRRILRLKWAYNIGTDRLLKAAGVTAQQGHLSTARVAF
ncbi:MAG TPA: glycoside hydrolase family 3 N-terminal domain-containing protein, partial [Ktedonobacterales bacterium]|nr:glycoside hydrolase family 3 N-terminal domain-containing protein [Ktedonobacterales bacterium]